jgi:hypothetical protein
MAFFRRIFETGWVDLDPQMGQVTVAAPLMSFIA